MNRENWGSRFGFIMATAGFAIGMGNIWRFPYIVGESGGGAFIIVYLILTAIIGVPLLTAEISLGRKAQLTPLEGMKKLSSPKSFWNIIGWVEIIATVMILGYYLMIMSWVTVYLKEYITGEAFAFSAETIQIHFTEHDSYSIEVAHINIGDTIEWLPKIAGHNVEFLAGPIMNELPEKSEIDATLSIVFTAPGVYLYGCTPHKNMGMLGWKRIQYN